MKLKKYLELLSYYIIPLTLLLLTIFLPDSEMFALFGNIAFILLLTTLFTKPLFSIFGLRILGKILVYRRQIGIALFWFFFFHMTGLMYSYGLISNLTLLTNTSSYLFYGLMAGIMITILAITSNNFAVRKLKKNWKRVQYLAYPALFVVLLHVSMVEGEIANFYILSGLYIILKIMEWKKVRIYFIKNMINI